MSNEDKSSGNFSIKEFRAYVEEIDKLADILYNLKRLTHYLDLKVYASRNAGKKHTDYYNEYDEINNKRNIEHIESMTRYVVKQQKKIVDEMYDKLQLDQDEK